MFAESNTRFFLKVVDAQVRFTEKDGKITGAILTLGRDVKARRLP